MNPATPMTDRARFLATMRYQPRDRCPICDFGFWEETVPQWHTEGLPANVNYNDYNGIDTDRWFGMDSYSAGCDFNVGLLPGFEYKVIEDQGDHEIVQQGDGVRVLRKKYLGSIPHHVAHLLVDRESWNEHYKPRLDPNDPNRFPKDIASARARWEGSDKPYVAWGGSLFGWIRDWMGLENAAMLVYDDPALFEEMVETLADCAVGVISKAVELGARFDACSMWEDMCYSGGPLLSPDHFKKILVPHYRRITDALKKGGCEIVWIDCDGKIDALIPLWLEGGVNCMFPIEVGTWGGDPVRYRKEYGKDLLLMGGFDKHVLQGDPDAIRKEVRRLVPLVEEGGFIPFPDHRVPPDVPYRNYLLYLEEARAIWGRGINLKPSLALEAVTA